MFVLIKLNIKLKMLLITWYIFTESSYSSFDLLKLGKLLHSDSGLALITLINDVNQVVESTVQKMQRVLFQSIYGPGRLCNPIVIVTDVLSHISTGDVPSDETLVHSS